MKTDRYQGIFPALYACYEDDGSVSPARTRRLVRYLLDCGVDGLYVNGSSGECIYLDVAERRLLLEAVMEEVAGQVPVIAHVACNNTRDSAALARHAESLGVAAVAAIPPIYFKLPPKAIAAYWNDISAAAPRTDMIIYNIPQLAGVALDAPLLREMLKNERVIGVKNSSMPVQDIQTWKSIGGEGFVVFNGPDEQLVSGLVMGACGGIGGTYGAMPQLYLKLYQLVKHGDLEQARRLQYTCNDIIGALCSTGCNMYAAIKETLRRQGLELGGVRAPLLNADASCEEGIVRCCAMIEDAIHTYC